VSWNTYKLTFKAKSPIHIGAYKTGMIQYTRHYIPAMTMWGAITSKLTKAIFDSPSSKDYETVGEFCNKCLLASYFFPMIEEDDILIPKYKEQKWMYGNNMLQTEFEGTFLSGYGSTAIDPSFAVAKEASLHEIQFLLPQVYYKKAIKKVCFRGYLIIKEGEYNKDCYSFSVVNKGDRIGLTANVLNNCVDIDIFELLNFIQVGGERTYGYGKLVLEKPIPTDKLWDNCSIDKSKELPILKISAQNESIFLPTHLKIPKELNKYHIYGKLEPLVSRRWCKDRGAGRYINKLETCFIPGSTFCSTDDLSFCIDDYGVLEVV